MNKRGARVKNMNNRAFGSIGEKLASEYLKKNGFTILERNFRAGRFGEIDIIATEREYICFIEVKTRTSSLFGTPAEAVGYAKREKLRQLAWIYLKQENLKDRNMRFDIIEVTGQRSNEEFKPEHIELIRSAF